MVGLHFDRHRCKGLLHGKWTVELEFRLSPPDCTSSSCYIYLHCSPSPMANKWTERCWKGFSAIRAKAKMACELTPGLFFFFFFFLKEILPDIQQCSSRVANSCLMQLTSGKHRSQNCGNLQSPFFYFSFLHSTLNPSHAINLKSMLSTWNSISWFVRY